MPLTRHGLSVGLALAAASFAVLVLTRRAVGSDLLTFKEAEAASVAWEERFLEIQLEPETLPEVYLVYGSTSKGVELTDEDRLELKRRLVQVVPSQRDQTSSSQTLIIPIGNATSSGDETSSWILEHATNQRDLMPGY